MAFESLKTVDLANSLQSDLDWCGAQCHQCQELVSAKVVKS